MSSKSSDFSASSSYGSISVDRNTSSFLFIYFITTNGGVWSLNINREVVFNHEYSSNFDKDFKAEKGFSKKAEMESKIPLFQWYSL